MKRFVRIVGVFLVSSVMPGVAMACPVCFGDQASAEVEGAKWAILFLLGVTGTVLSGVATLILYIRRRAKISLAGTNQKLIDEER